MTEKIQMVPLSRLEESSDNPRKLFGNLTEFAKTLKGGILQPLVAREVSGDKLELVIGHRRFRGAKLIGLKEVPVIVREYTRQQAVEAMVIENVHREDVNAIELADSFAQMRQDFGLTADQISERVKLPRTTVYDMLSLHDNLFDAAKKAVLAGKLGTIAGIAISRVRGERLQAAALAEVLKLAKKEGEQPSARAVKKLVQDKYLSPVRQGLSKKAREARAHGADVAIRKAVMQRLLVRVGELVERRAQLSDVDLRSMAMALADVGGEPVAEVLKRRGKPGKAVGAQLRSLVVEAALAPWLQIDPSGEYSAGSKAVARAYGLSLAELEKAVEAEAKAEELFKPGS